MSDDATGPLKLSFRTHPVDPRALDEAGRVAHIAAHEAGHAVVAHALGIGVTEIRIRDEIVEEGLRRGYVLYEAEDNLLTNVEAPQLHIGAAMMGGVCAEEVIFGRHLEEGWAGDIKLLRIILGMASAATREEARERVANLVPPIELAYETAKERRDELQAVTTALLESDRGYLTGDDLGRLVSGG